MGARPKLKARVEAPRGKGGWETPRAGGKAGQYPENYACFHLGMACCGVLSGAKFNIRVTTITVKIT